MDSPKYLYGIISFSGQVSGATLALDADGTPVYAIPCLDIACVVSDSGVDISCGDRKALIRRLQGHQAVMESVIKDHVIIPIKFGTRLNGKRAVESVLEAGYADFKTKLESMKGKMEADVTALWSDLDSVLRKIADESREIKTLKAEIAGKPPEETFSERIKIGAVIKSALDKKREEVQNRILERLCKEALSTRLLDVTDDNVILGSAFLIEKEKEASFEKALNGINEELDGSVNFKYVSPLPPYSFCTMEVKEVGYDEIRKAREMLELGEEATAKEIRESYQRKALACHPDKDPGNPVLGAMFEELTRSYRLLDKFCRGERCSFKSLECEGFLYVEAVNS